MSSLRDCPSCGVQMEIGFVIVGNWILWSPIEHKFWAWTAHTEVLVPTQLTLNNVKAFRCKNCKVVVFKY